MKSFICLFLFFSSLLFAEPPTSITDSIGDYKTLCKKAAESEKIFSKFKSYSVYQEALEICNRELGLQFAAKIFSQYSDFLPYVDVFRKNDFYGSPVTYEFPNLGRFSPATLRYISIACDICTMIPLPDSPRIVEIGVGYGGQCFILSSILSFDQYAMIDLPEVLPLAKKYLDRLEVDRVDFFTADNIPLDVKYDLFISNYAFSECSREVQLAYFEKVIKHCERGFVLFNQISDYWNIDSLSLSEFVDLLTLAGFKPALFLEEPLTSSQNILIIW